MIVNRFETLLISINKRLINCICAKHFALRTICSVEKHHLNVMRIIVGLMGKHLKFFTEANHSTHITDLSLAQALQQRK